MADDIVLNPGVGGDTLSADQVATLNGIAIAGPKVQRAKLAFGSPGASSDVDQAHPLPVALSQAPARHAWGQALAVTPSETAIVASVIASAGYALTGMVCTGVGEGYFVVQVASVPVLSGRTRASMPTLVIVLPHGLPVQDGATAVLRVTNEAGETADFEGALLGV